jgi:hypothetical protein
MKLKRRDDSSLVLPVIRLQKLRQQIREHQPEQTLNCISCRTAVTSPKDRIEIKGQHAHTFTNPHGYSFTIGCFAHAVEIAAEGEPSDFWSWFPGYQWQIVLCRQCGLHLGWRFISTSDFYGFILNRLISVDLT